MKLLSSFKYAFNGIVIAFKEQLNIKIHVASLLFVICAGLYFGITLIEWILLAITIALVIGFELINSAIENLVDLISPQQHPLAGKIKDIAAGAVLVIAIASLVIGALIFYKYVNIIFL